VTELQAKGVVMVGAADVLLSDRARFEPHLAPGLSKYLDDPPFAGDWYPIPDLLGLCEAIRLGVYPNVDAREAYEMMGVVTAKRDLYGDARVTPKEARTGRGAYQGALGAKHDLPTNLRRALALWQLYFDQGEQVAERAGLRQVRTRLVGAVSPAIELCWMTTGCFKAVLESLELDAVVEHTRCTTRGDDVCEWTVTHDDAFDPTPLDAFGPPP